MAIVAVFALLALFSIISIVLERRGPRWDRANPRDNPYLWPMLGRR